MTTLIDKVKTIIEYARFGVFFAKWINGEDPIDELFFPRAVKTYSGSWNAGYNHRAKKISGYLQTFGGAYCLGDNKPTVEIDLPYCTVIGDNPTNNSINTTLKIMKLPSYRSVSFSNFSNLQALEYLELGKVTSFGTGALGGCSSLKELYIKEGSTSSLFLYPCPNLTQECLHKIIENLADMTGTSGANFHVGADNMGKIDYEHRIMLEEKNFFYQ